MDETQHVKQSGWNRFCKMLRWEKRIQMVSARSADQVIEALQTLVLPAESWRNYVPFASNRPLIGDLVGHRGRLTCKDRWPRASCGRALKFTVEPLASGSVLRGVLQLRLSLYIYEWMVIAGALFMEIATLYGVVIAKSPDYQPILLNLLRPLGFAPFLWCYIRLGLWFGRKREAELLNLVQDALIQKPMSLPLVPRPSSPTEVFMRPRHENPAPPTPE